VYKLPEKAKDADAFVPTRVFRRHPEDREAGPSAGVEGSSVLIENYVEGSWDEEASLIEKEKTCENSEDDPPNDIRGSP
jgi:hypothetical protein